MRNNVPIYTMRWASTEVNPPPKLKPEEPKLEVKPPLWDRIKHEVAHYRDGTKLLGLETKISAKLLAKMATGYELSRREHKQLQRTISDILRLFPFLMFVIIPFLELLLPVALKLFPNLLPSTYESKLDKEKKAKLLRKTRTKVSQTLKDMRSKMKLPSNISEEESKIFHDFYSKLKTAKELDIRTDEIIKVARLFKDDSILDNLSRAELVAMARYINLKPFGTDSILRYLIRNKMLEIKQDDRAISYEGISNLTTTELQLACMSRGIKVHGVVPSVLRDDLQMWLKMRLVDKIPSTLIILSTAYNYGSTPNAYKSQYEALKAVLTALPEEIYHETHLNVSSQEEITHKQRLEVIEEQESLIKSENKQTPEIPVKDTKSLDDDLLETKPATETVESKELDVEKK